MLSLRTQRQLSGVESDQIALPPASPSDNETATLVSISLRYRALKSSRQIASRGIYHPDNLGLMVGI